ncbi:hypothetical protein CMQ_7618 [Grosmannia clavigera kw1407]|uniref:Uncharacterized protein n=1 Tax=Grosmannia clavigera (strain kw1407 / UAMH 11150) TaxID=655863 RepID=F0XPK7_GROCL|nr:uncharacterized protein CMQ_7618 [Grosmannia clavigera kw1407]EFX00616.1 hypothetical protein CMQ_7618 [Grosmannia clavigera kw1407]
MATVLGKRKPASASATKAASDNDHDGDTIQDTAAKKATKAKTTRETTVSDDERSDWSGLSDEDEDGESERVSNSDSESDGAEPVTPSVQVIDYSSGASAADLAGNVSGMTKQERRAYLSSRPPALDDRRRSASTTTAADTAAADGADGANTFKDAPDLLANDLALQRLIAESHLLSAVRAPSTTGADPASLKSARPFAAGRLRQHATDLRIQAVARRGVSGFASSPAASAALAAPPNSAHSIYTQTSMPMAIRKGISGAAAARESKRRREARESGIVLERPATISAASSSIRRRRQRAVDAPSVGRLHGSELRLRESDVRAIEGHRSGSSSIGHKKHKKRR